MIIECRKETWECTICCTVLVVKVRAPWALTKEETEIIEKHYDDHVDLQ